MHKIGDEVQESMQDEPRTNGVMEVVNGDSDVHTIGV